MAHQPDRFMDRVLMEAWADADKSSARMEIYCDTDNGFRVMFLPHRALLPEGPSQVTLTIDDAKPVSLAADAFGDDNTDVVTVYGTAKIQRALANARHVSVHFLGGGGKTGEDAFTFGFFIGKDTRTVGRLLGEALPPISAIMLIIGAGGALKQMLIDVGLGAVIAHASQLVNLSPLLLAWFTAVILRLATGSATVAIVTASGLMAATVTTNPGLSPALMALSIGSGSLFFSHINDAGFWLVKEYMGMNLPNMFKTWSVLETIIAVMGLFLCLGLSLVI